MTAEQPLTEGKVMRDEARENARIEIGRFFEGLKAVIESGSNLAHIYFESHQAKSEASPCVEKMPMTSLSTMIEPFLTAEETAELLKVKIGTLYTWVEKKQNPSFQGQFADPFSI